MRERFWLFLCGVILVLAVQAAQAADAPEVGGVFGVKLATEETYVALWVPVQTGAVVAGIEWYSSDGAVACPRVLVDAGEPGRPGSVADATAVADDVQCSTMAWVTTDFSQPVTSVSGGLYVFIKLPSGISFTEQGLGGGFGLGYVDGDGTRGCWLSGDGVNWNPMSPQYKMAIVPVFDVAKSHATVLTLGERRDSLQSEGAEVPHLAVALTAHPNPFNPQVTIRFGLESTSRADVAVYDIRGHRVSTLASETMNAGHHEVVWNGLDANRRRVASGTYFIRLAAGSRNEVCRVVLLK